MEMELHRLARADLDRLFAALGAAGYTCLAPQVDEDVIQYRPLKDAASLPHGWHDRQGPASYRLERTDSVRCFAWADGAQGLKPLNFAPRESLWRAARDASGTLRFEAVTPQPTPTAVIGVRACDLAALALQDQHFLDGPHPDPYYAARRESLFLVAVHCTHPAQTCFCASTGDGPQAQQGYDIAMFETDDAFLLHAGSEPGRQLIEQLALAEATHAEYLAALAEVQAAARAQTRTLPGRNLRESLFGQLEHPRWEEVGERCLSCGNCTSVCPTCFCHAEGEDPALDGRATTHYREWGSCFTAKHSYVGGWVPRSDTRLRYRQWLTHKLGSWHEQYGRSGCVGCGRCITWCPVGIDLTEEAAAICGEVGA
jgi:ferredoxin